MKNKYVVLFRLFIVVAFSLNAISVYAGKNDREYYKLVVYHFKNAAQEKVLDNYFANALLPALHKLKMSNIGVFKALANDTAADKTIYVFMTFKSLDDIQNMSGQLEKDASYQTAGSEYINSIFSSPPYTRMETMILYAFPLAPKMQLPQLKSAKSERVYELRSYEGATEKIYQNKVTMFNVGDEIGLFKRLNFNAVFYSEVLAGSKMPNLMYMTTFENMEDREKHWKAFSDDPQWKKLVAAPEYQNNVSHADIIFLRPAGYSEL
ncbi:MAG: family containing protein [Chitinophagaceae bacterium]|nr:family containing protein [Chitinophagaceae bacterium]